MAAGQDGVFKERHFTSEVILWALRWRLAFPIGYRDLAAMLADRGVAVDHTTLFRRVQAYAGGLEQRVRPGLGFSDLETAKRTLAGYEVLAMIRDKQVHNSP